MGLRGKIEAVIYAAEEPVTLSQLAALFGEEALAERGGGQDSHLAEAQAEGSVSPETAEDATGHAAASAVQTAPRDGSDTLPPGVEAKATESAGVSSPAQPDPAHEAGKHAARVHERARREAVRAVLDALMAEYDREDRGMEIREIAGGFRVATRPEYHDAVRGFAKSLKPPMKLTLQALETLAVIAYKQPVTAPEVSEIRGVDSGGVLGSLVSRKLVMMAGRKQVVGRPILYKTTREFLLRFGLKDLNELPSMEEFEKMAGELASMGEEPLPSGPGGGRVEPAPRPPAEIPGEGAAAMKTQDEMSDKRLEGGPDGGSSGGPNASSGSNASDEGRPEGSLGERPRLEPLVIAVDVEEVEPAGVSVDRSGNPVEDAAHGSAPPAGGKEAQDG